MEVLVKMSFVEVKPNSENIDWDPRVCQLKFPGRSRSRTGSGVVVSGVVCVDMDPGKIDEISE